MKIVGIFSRMIFICYLFVLPNDMCALGRKETAKSLLRTVGRLHKNIFATESLKIIAGTLPFYLQARVLDNHIQECFYKGCCHKNINQLHSSCTVAAKYGVVIPVVLFSTFAFFADDEELQKTSKVFLLGVPFVIIGKNIIKNFEADFCLRPPCEHFDKHKRVHGGFPSGHMAEAVYIATLFGMRYGKKAAIPLGAFAGFVGYTFISCNRHYGSQIVAGAALGAIYGIAASKVVDSDLNNNFSLSLESAPNGGAAVGITYTF